MKLWDEVTYLAVLLFLGALWLPLATWVMPLIASAPEWGSDHVWYITSTTMSVILAYGIHVLKIMVERRKSSSSQQHHEFKWVTLRMVGARMPRWVRIAMLLLFGSIVFVAIFLYAAYMALGMAHAIGVL